MKKRFLTYLLAAFCSLGIAQSGTPIHLEFPCSQYSTELQCIPCRTQGLCVCYPTLTTDDSTVLNLQQYDVNLAHADQLSITMPPSLSYAASEYSNGRVYILYQNKSKRKRDVEGMLLCYFPDSRVIEQQPLRNLPFDNISHFSVNDDQITFICGTGKDNSNLFFAKMGNDYIKPLYLENAPDYSIECYHSDTIQHNTLVCVNTASNTKNNVIWLVETNREGNVQRAIDLPDTGNVRFQNARIARIDSTRFLLSGTYQHRKGSFGNTADGTYTIIYEGGQFTEPTLRPFNSARSNNARSNNNDVLYLYSRIYHDSTRYVTISESFHPEYRYSTTYSYGIPTTEPIFVGYRFLNADIRIYSQEDTLLWEYTFPFDNMLVTNLTTHLRADFVNNNILFYYITQKSLTTMLLDTSMEIIDPIRTSEIFPQSRQSTNTVYTTGITRWYNNYFLLIGYKFPQNGNNKTKKTAYFVNKLLYN